MALAKAVGDDDVERLSELLACREAEDPFGSLVAEADDALRISIDDGVRGVVHQLPVEPVDLAQLAQFEGRFEILLLMLVKEIKGLAGVLGANRRVVPTIPIFF